jgi:demethylspheroidene O-methyltransferase
MPDSLPVLPIGGLPAPSGWRSRLRAWRESCLANPRFQRWAAAFPPTRPIARRNARALFDVVAGFVYSQVLHACVQLELLPRLRGRPATVEELAAELRLRPDAVACLLRAAASLRLVEPRGAGRFGLGEQGAALLGNPGAIAMVRHHAVLYRDLADPVATLRAERGSTGLARYWAYAADAAPGELPADRVDEYTSLMAESQGLVASEILDAYALGRHRVLLDVGGGDGSFLAAAAARWPRLQLQLFDLPPVVERARRRFAAAGLEARATPCGGDFRRDPLPVGADLVSLVRVLHDHDDEVVLRILREVARILPPDGRVLIAEPMSGTTGAEPMGDAYFGLYLFAMGSGRPRTVEELAGLLDAAGFGPPVVHRTHVPLLTRVVVAAPRRDRRSVNLA